MFEMLSFVLSGLFHVDAIVSQRKVDASIVFFSMPCGPLGLYLRLRHAVPYVISLRGGDVPGLDARVRWMHRLLAPLRRWVLRRATAVVANSEGLASVARRSDPGQVEVIPNGVDTALFTASDDSTRDYLFLFVGRFSKEKNPELLLRTFARLGTRLNQPPGLMLVGAGPEEVRLKRLAAELGLSQLVRWQTWCTKPDLIRHYQQAQCLLSPSVYEGMPNAVLEAMACGIPVIASRVSGHEDLVVDGVNGYLYDPQRPDDLLEAWEIFRAPAR